MGAETILKVNGCDVHFSKYKHYYKQKFMRHAHNRRFDSVLDVHFEIETGFLIHSIWVEIDEYDKASRADRRLIWKRRREFTYDTETPSWFYGDVRIDLDDDDILERCHVVMVKIGITKVDHVELREGILNREFTSKGKQIPFQEDNEKEKECNSQKKFRERVLLRACQHISTVDVI